MDYSPETLLILFVTVVVAECYGAIFGGGGFLVQPVMLLLGVPPHMVVANDMTAATGTALSSAYVFRKNKLVLFDVVKLWLPGILLGPMVGAYLLAYTPAWVIEKLILILCVGGGFWMIFRPLKTMSEENQAISLEGQKLKSGLSGFFVGVYFGFSGAGGGTLTSLILMNLFGLSFKQSIGTRKFIHLPIMIIAALSYYMLGLLDWAILPVMFVGCLIAGWLGSHIAIKFPEKILRPVFFIMILRLQVGHYFINFLVKRRVFKMNMIVTSKNPGDTVGTLSFGGKTYPCTLGPAGIKTEKTEGDGVTPAGCFPLRRVYYRQDRVQAPKTGLSVQPIEDKHAWCEDPEHADYNSLVELPHPATTDALTRADHLYDIIIVVGHNDDPVVPGDGSAIFIHLARHEFTPTQGCIGLAQEDLLEILGQCDTNTHVEIREV